MSDTKSNTPPLPIAVSLLGAANLIGVSESTIDQAIRAELLSARRHGNRTLIRVADLVAFVDAMPVGRNAAPPQLEGRRTGRPSKKSRAEA